MLGLTFDFSILAVIYIQILIALQILLTAFANWNGR